MPKICISYRRSDSEGITGRIFDRLVSQYGRDSIFRDIDSVPAGTDFREHVSQMLMTTDVLLVIVGPKWTGARRGGGTRINDETDLVRIEVATGLTNGMVVIPILVGDTKMPSDDLPPSLREFAFRNAMRVDPGVDFDQHMQRLTRAVDGLLAQRSETPPAIEAPPPLADSPRAAVALLGAQNAPKAAVAATAGRTRNASRLHQLSHRDDRHGGGCGGWPPFWQSSSSR
jgi:TIR domain